METIKLKVSHSPEFLTTPESFTIALKREDKSRIRKIWRMIKSNLFDEARITFYGEAEPLEFDEDSEWRADVCQLVISAYGIYYREQSKYDSTAYLETETVNPKFLTHGINEKAEVE